jgi:enediyne biosynthesis protein E4
MQAPRTALLALAAATLVGCPSDPDVSPTPAELPEEITALPVTECVGDDATWVETAASRGVDFVAPPPARGEEPQLVIDQIVGGGAAVIDLTGDELPDLVLTSPWGANAVYRNLGDGTFERCEDAGLEGGDLTYAPSAVDLNGDNLPEVVLLERGQVRVFRNGGDCRFSEMDPLMVSADPNHMPTGAAWTDYDGDGFVDVYVSVRGAQEWAEEGVANLNPDRLFRGLPNSQFEDVTDRAASPAAREGHAFVAAWLDADLDGDLDIYVGNDHGADMTPNQLLVRDGDPSAPSPGFTEQSSTFGLDLGTNAMGLAVGDIEGDGRLQIAVSDTAELYMLELDGTIATDRTLSLGLSFDKPAPLAGWGVELADLDHDLDLDFLAAWGWKEWDRDEPVFNDLWLWEEGGFRPATPLPGPDGGTTWRTMIPVDLDADGTLEIVSTSLVGPVSILSRECEANAWMEIALRDGPGNRDGLGALVEVWVGDRILRRRIGIGSSGVHQAAQPTAHFGLGDATVVERMRITWADGADVEYEALPVRSRLVVERL